MLFDESKPTSIVKSREFWWGLLILVIFYSHYPIVGQDSFWYANDYSELVIHWYKLLVDNAAVFKSNDYPVPGMLDTLPRGIFATEMFLKTWFFFFLEPFQAIVVNKLFIHFLAYCSAFHLLSKVSYDWLKGPISLYALLWACIPFWPESGIGLAFTPTIFWIFYRFDQGGKFSLEVFLLFAFFSFYSYLHLNGVFLMMILSVWGIYSSFLRRKIRWNFWLALSLLGILYIICSYRLFDIYFFQRDWFTPHRIEYDIYSFGRYHRSLSEKINQILLSGSVHATFISPLIYLTIAGYLITARYLTVEMQKYLVILKIFLFVNLVALIAALLTFIPLVEKAPIIIKINQFSFERFYFLVYPLMIFCFILIIDELITNFKLKKLGWMLLISLLSYNYLVLDDHMRNKILKPLLNTGFHYPTYKELFAEKQFEEIKTFLNVHTNNTPFKVANIGMHPAVASYNGLWAIDGYTGNYPLSYKHKIRDIIITELGSDHKENWLYWHFMGWGNKGYIFNQTHGDDFFRLKWFERVPLHAPSYNYDKILELGCKFILSTDPILEEERLTLLKIFDHPESAWLIHLYEIQPLDY